MTWVIAMVLFFVLGGVVTADELKNPIELPKD